MGNRNSIVYGIGINDAGYSVRDKKSGWWCPVYKKWSAMLERCYSPKYHAAERYEKCTVCEEWLYFSNFKVWLESFDYKDKQLDKDLLVKDNTIYSPEKCCLVSRKVNSFLTDGGSSRKTDLPLGAYVHNYKKNGVIITTKFRATCCNPFTRKKEHLGLFDCPEKAHKAWKERKHEHACQLAELETDPRIIEALRTRYLPENIK